MPALKPEAGQLLICVQAGLPTEILSQEKEKKKENKKVWILKLEPSENYLLKKYLLFSSFMEIFQ